MKTAFFHYCGPPSELRERKLLTAKIPEALATTLRVVNPSSPEDGEWQVTLPSTLLFDRRGLGIIERALQNISHDVEVVSIYLRPAPHIMRDYYSLKKWDPSQETLPLGITARRRGGSGPSQDIEVELPHVSKMIEFPRGLAEPSICGTPLALVMPYQSDFDLLLANQIAVVAELAARISRSPLSWVRAAFSWRGGGDFRERCSRAFTAVHPTARVHRAAVIEGSIIGPHTRVGAHAVIRHSIIGSEVTIQDGAKVELSVVGDRSWLMQDLVLYRSLVEDEVFLIHGPYQFSAFFNASAAFATIMMDYRADARPIMVPMADGKVPYEGRFLGAVLRERAKCLGGTLLAPGRIVPEDTWLAPDADQIHSLKYAVPKRTAVGPRCGESCADQNGSREGVIK